MATNFPVKRMSSTMRGAPQIDGSAGGGGYVAALYAFLITGWGPTTALAVTISGGVATATFNAGVYFEDYSVIQISGATSPAALNGEARVISHTGNTITFATSAPDGVATGDITIKYAPVGWECPFKDGNKAVFRSADPQSPRFFVRIDDTGSTETRIRGYESMTDIDTGVNPFPTDAQISGGGYHYKSIAANSTKVLGYELIADSRFYLFGICASTTAVVTANMPLRGFGDLIALAPGGDPWVTAISCAGQGGATSGTSNSYGCFDFANSSPHNIYCAREFSGAGGSLAIASVPYIGNTSGISGNDNSLGVFPSSIDGEVKYSRRYVRASDNATPRAHVPGVLYCPQYNVLQGGIRPGDLIHGSGEMAGRMLLAIGAGSSGANSAASGIKLVDLTGPWR